MKTLLVIPCYNEERRIQIDAFQAAPDNLSFLFVDDGSKDGTQGILQKLDGGRFHVIRLDRNGGKAEAVRQGMLHANSHPNKFSFDWIGYWDADLSTPLYEVENFIRFNEEFGGDKPVVFGSRVFRFGSDIRRYSHRHYLGRIFATVVRLFFGIGSYDSQCGAKIFKKEAMEKCFSEKFVSRWIFDVEIILRLGNKDIVEYPLKEWRDVSGGQLSVIKTAFAVIGDIYHMRKKYEPA